MRALTWLYLSLLISSCSRWAEAPDLTLVPVPQKERPPLQLALRHLETPMGGGEPRPVTDAIVSIDHAEVFAVLFPYGRSAMVVPRPKAFDLYVVRIDFTLHPPAGDKRLKEVSLGISLKDPKAVGLDVFPKRLDSAREVPRSLQVKTLQLQPRRDDSGPIAAEGLEPVVVGFQRGNKEASWTLQGPDGTHLRPGPRRVFLLVRTSPGGQTLRGTVYCQGTAETRKINQWWSFPEPQTDRQSLEVDLLGPAR